MKTFIAILITAICIISCGTTRWCHPTKGPEDFERDKWECVYGMGGDIDAKMMHVLELKR